MKVNKGDRVIIKKYKDVEYHAGISEWSWREIEGTKQTIHSVAAGWFRMTGIAFTWPLHAIKRIIKGPVEELLEDELFEI